METAFHGDGDQDLVIVIERRGGMRMLDPSGWTLPALSAEFGAAAVYRVSRRLSATRVEGLCGSERCLFERRNQPSQGWSVGMPGMPAFPAPAAPSWMPRVAAIAAA